MCTPSQGVKDTKFTVTGLHAGKDYRVRVRAINTAGLGEPSALQDAYQPKDILIAPELEVDAEIGQYVTVRAGGTIRLFSIIRGRPTPTAKWSKHNGVINSMALIETTEYSSLLIINNCSRDDAGR